MIQSLRTRSAALLLVLAAFLVGPVDAQEIPSPEDFFGHVMGADRALARWDRLVEYYHLLGERSPRLEVRDMGPSTMGHPFLVLFHSAPENLARLDELQAYNRILSDPRGASQADIDAALANGKAVVVQSFCLHSTEVAGGQTAAEIAWEMVTRDDEEMRGILENTVSIMIPCFNPDGQIMVTDWYRRLVGTEWEGVGPPSLYHKYIGHDNNRDAFMQNTVESVYGAEILFREWVPQAFVDHHQMGPFTARIYVPPYAEPIRPEGDPLVWREMAWFGAHMAYRLEEEGYLGTVGAAIYSGWGHFGFHWITPFHNIAGMLTESASARLATPLFVHPEQLQGSRQLPEYEAQTTFPSPWPGGWWRVRDIVERQKVAFFATLDIAARDRESVLRSAWLKARRQIERGQSGDPAAWVIPAEQHDVQTMHHMVNKLLLQGIEVRRTDREFAQGGRIYGPGSFIVTMAQPKRGVIRWLLGQTFYPDNGYTRNRDGEPIRPYDMSTDNMAEFMGVRVDPVDVVPDVGAQRVAEHVAEPGTVQVGSRGYRMDGRENAAFRAFNLLADEGIPVRRVQGGAAGPARPGDFILSADASSDALADIATRTGVDFQPLEAEPADAQAARRLRIGMYQRYYGGNMDEGWTRWLLEDFGFPYTTLMDEQITAGDLTRRYDVILLPADDVRYMTGDLPEDGEGFGRSPEDYPPEYRSGFGEAGVEALEAFVREGGTLVTFAQAGDLVLQEFDVPVRNVVDGLPSTEFWSPGSTLRVRVETGHPMGLGMPDRALATVLARNQVYEVIPGERSHQVERVVSFVDRDILESGWLLGEDVIADRAAMVSVRHGQGRVVMIGFRAQHRAQTHGTFKLVFNALVGGGAGADVADAGP